MRPLVVLLTGFGPFPGAPYNPTGELVRRLARIRRPGLNDVKIVVHVFPTSYRAVDTELSRLLAETAPDALLMFGVAVRRRHLYVETRARNTISPLARDAEGKLRPKVSIVAGGPAVLPSPAPVRRLVLAARRARVSAFLSRDAGRYLCNYLSWRGIEASQRGGPRSVAFIHVPMGRGTKVRRRPGRRAAVRMADMLRASQAMLLTTVAAARADRRR